jgi:hypothetical protein
MIIIRNEFEMKAAIATSTNLTLQALLSHRLSQLAEHDASDIGVLASFLIVQPGDGLAAVETELLFSPAINFVDQARFGDPNFEPSWEGLKHQGDWYEMTFVLNDDGFGWILFIADSDDTDRTLLALCRTYRKGE